MYKNVLVPLDGSDSAEAAIPYAVEICKATGAGMSLVGVHDPACAGVDNMYSHYLEHAAEKVRKLLVNPQAQHESSVRTRVLAGKPADEILRFAEESNVDLILITKQGQSGPAPWSLGTVAARVLSATVRPTLLVKSHTGDQEHDKGRAIRRILAPLDGSKDGEAALPHAAQLARALGAELVLFHVLEPIVSWAGTEGQSPNWAAFRAEEERTQEVAAKKYLTAAKAAFADSGPRTSTAMMPGLAAEAITDYAKTNAIDLIAMSTHGRTGIRRILLGSVTYKVLNTGETPVLAVRNVQRTE